MISFRIKAKQTGYDTEALVHLFKLGLKQGILRNLYTLQIMPTNLDGPGGWYEKAIMFDRNYREYLGYAEGRAPPPSRSTGQRPSGGTTYGGSGQPMEVDRTKKKTKCFFCGIAGHSKQECRQFLNGCFRCKKKGHANRDCTEGIQKKARMMTEEEREDRLAKGKCFTCGEQGHIARDCGQKTRIVEIEEESGKEDAQE